MKLLHKHFLWLAVITSFALLVFYSCATFQLPEPGSNTQSILIIPTVKEKGISQSHFAKFEFYVKGMKGKIILDPRYRYTMIVTLKPGDYEIYKIKPIYDFPGPNARPLEVHIKFKLQPGQITILSSALYWQMFSRGMYYGVDKFPEDERMKLISELRTHKNFHLWTLSN